MNNTLLWQTKFAAEDKQDINRQIMELKAAGAYAWVFKHEHSDTIVKQHLQSMFNAST